MTTTTSTSTTTASTGSSILTALNAGSGIDTGSLVNNLAAATYDPQVAAITAKQTANTAEVSAVSSVSSSISGFASVLTSLISGGTLMTQPTSSDTGVVTATAKAGAQVGALSAQLTVQQVAKSQSLVSGYFAASTTAVGSGGLSITVGGATYQVKLDSNNNSVAGIARAINSAMSSASAVSGNSGVTASVVTDGSGARLALKGPTGLANAFTITATPGSDASLLQLAYPPEGMTVSGSTVVSADLSDETSAPVGTGSFTLSSGSANATITIDGSNNTLDGMVSAINAANVGLTASVATDSGGAHLVISGPSGSTAAPSFTLTPASGADTGLSRFAFPATSTGMTQAQAAQDAVVELNGVKVTRSSNTISDLVDGVTLNLVNAAPSETVTLGATRPTAAIKSAVQNFVDYYNDLKSTIDGFTGTTTDSDGNAVKGALYGVSGIKALQQQLAKLPTTVLSTASGGPSTLAEIGVKTERDGTLSLDTTVLSKALTNNPDGVEALFNPTQHSSNPLIRITSDMGQTPAGTYTLTGIKAGVNGGNPQGSINGKTASPLGNGQLAAAYSSGAFPLSIAVDGDVASATITVDPGLGGVLKTITDALSDKAGTIAALNSSLATQKTDLAKQQSDLSDDETDYRTRMTNQFSQMNSDVTNYKSILSYLQQQIAVWTKSDN